MKLYHHKTSGGAEYLMDTFITCPNGEKEGVFEGARYIVRIDGDIRKDAELTVVTRQTEAFTKTSSQGKPLVLTKADAEAHARITKPDWFQLHEVSYLTRNPRWRMERLVAHGLLEARVVGQIGGHLWTEWRKLPAPPVAKGDSSDG